MDGYLPVHRKEDRYDDTQLVEGHHAANLCETFY